MKRIYTVAIGLVMMVAPMVAAPGLASADPATRPVDYQQLSDVVIARGLAQRGVPFSWAGGGVYGPTRGTGTGINTVGFDASGLVQYAYAGAGLKLPRSSGQMYKVGQKVLPQQARKADLIFYGPEGTQSVALYLGNGKMLEVSDVVQVSRVRSKDMAPYLVRILGTQSAPVQQAHCSEHRFSKPRLSDHRCGRHQPSNPRRSKPQPRKPQFSRPQTSSYRRSRHQHSKLLRSRFRHRRCLRSRLRRSRLRSPLWGSLLAPTFEASQSPATCLLADCGRCSARRQVAD